ncbi:MAG: hypothetical protein JSU69_08305 [Candidatus Zixiibacteriota bacterium]|nr:MAG: hypothetical protein JSU69_08305 [candidate division Zixibacteria bacterium]
MSRKKLLISAIAILLLMSGNLLAQDDKYGEVDTLYAVSYPTEDGKTWAVDVSMFNDDSIMALSVPLTFSDGKNRVVVSSWSFEGTVVQDFRVKHVRVDTSTQCVTIGLINDVGVSVPPVPPGKGLIAKLFITSLDNKKIKSLKVDTTTTPPSNNLQFVKPPTEGIIPAFVSILQEKPAKEKPKEEAKEKDE